MWNRVVKEGNREADSTFFERCEKLQERIPERTLKAFKEPTYTHNSFLTYKLMGRNYLENRFTRERRQRTCIHVIKFAFKPCGTLRL